MEHEKEVEVEYCSYKSVESELPTWWESCYGSSIDRHILISARSQSDGLVGLLMATYAENDTLQIKFLFVLPTYRSRKIGSMLVQKLITSGQAMSYSISIVRPKRISNTLLFFNNNGFEIDKIECSGFIITKNDWIECVLPRLEQSSNSHPIACKSSELLTDKDRETIHRSINAELPKFLHPWNNSSTEQVFFFYEEDKELIGWSAVSLSSPYVAELRCTFILPQYRNLGYVFSIWYFMTKYIHTTAPQVSRLLFYYDHTNTRLERFYRFLLCQCPHQCIDRLVLKYEIPIF